MSRQPLWVNIKGTRFDTGWVQLTVEGRLRYIESEGKTKLNTSNPVFLLLEDLLLQWGYNCEIFPNGNVSLVVPVSDQYGKICREIAKTYFLAMNPSVFPTQQKLQTEATK